MPTSDEHECAVDQGRPVSEQRVKCHNCGYYNVEGGKYCTHCGLLISNLKECPDCHAPIAYNDRYCPRCGRVIRPEKITGFSVRPLAALILSIIPGMFSIWNMGHFFAGSPNKGLALFLLGLMLVIVAPRSLYSSSYVISATCSPWPS